MEMSLLPLVMDLLESNYNRNAYDQHFGTGLPSDMPLRPLLNLLLSPSFRNGYLRPWRSNVEPSVPRISNDKNEFKINLDVQLFKPDEIKVKVVDGYLVIEGDHEERSDDHGLIARKFTRRYKIPENVIQESLESSLSSDGILMVKAPKKVSEKEGRTIPIVQTKMPAVTNEKEKKTDKKDEKMES